MSLELEEAISVARCAPLKNMTASVFVVVAVFIFAVKQAAGRRLDGCPWMRPVLRRSLPPPTNTKPQTPFHLNSIFASKHSPQRCATGVRARVSRSHAAVRAAAAQQQAHHHVQARPCALTVLLRVHGFVDLCLANMDPFSQQRRLHNAHSRQLDHPHPAGFETGLGGGGGLVLKQGLGFG